MKLTNKLAILAASILGLSLAPVQAGDNAGAYTMWTDGNLYPAGEDDYDVKVNADKKLGLQWYMEAAAGFWSATGTETSHPNPQGAFLIHGQVAKRILSSNEHSGLWLRAEIAGSLGADSSVRRTENDFNSVLGSFTTAQADYMGGAEFVLPEIVLTQFFKKDRAALHFGVINLTNYFDAVGIANCTFSSFTNSGFVNSTVLQLVDSNLGGVFQFQIDDSSWFMLGAARTVTEPGFNPFRSGRGASYVGEYGRTFADGKGAFRINPFLNNQEVEKANGDTKLAYNYGLAGSVEYTFSDRVAVFARAGFSARSEYGTDNDFSVGTHVRPFASRENDYFGVAFGMFKPGGDAETTGANGNHEKVVELMYNAAITDRLFIVPHLQFIVDPAGNDATDSEIFWGVQAVFNF